MEEPAHGRLVFHDVVALYAHLARRGNTAAARQRLPTQRMHDIGEHNAHFVARRALEDYAVAQIIGEEVDHSRPHAEDGGAGIARLDLTQRDERVGLRHSFAFTLLLLDGTCSRRLPCLGFRCRLLGCGLTSSTLLARL